MFLTKYKLQEMKMQIGKEIKRKIVRQCRKTEDIYNMNEEEENGKVVKYVSDSIQTTDDNVNREMEKRKRIVRQYIKTEDIYNMSEEEENGKVVEYVSH